MAEPSITPHRITKPIQLLAAWLAGLAIVDAGFLTAAATIRTPSWVPGLLAIAAVVNVPLFIVSLFLLQTKFRPEMQEDTFYSKYLERKYSTSASAPEPVNPEEQIRELADRIVSELTETTTDREDHVVKILKESEVSALAYRFRENRTLSELHLYPHLWHEIVDSWSEDSHFKESVSSLIQAGLLAIPEDDVRKASLTSVGTEVAQQLESRKQLWTQEHKRRLKHTVKERKAES